MSEKKRRSIAPAVLIVAGLAGLGLAAASELDLGWNGTFQAGTIEVAADCQTDGEIAVAFSKPDFKGTDANTGTPWEVAELQFSNISDACKNHDYEVAVRKDENGAWDSLAVGTVGEIPITVGVADTNPQDFYEVALTIHDSNTDTTN